MRRPARVCRTAGNDLRDAQAVLLAPLLGEGRRQRGRSAGQAEVGTTHLALSEEGRDDLTGGAVDRNGQTHADSSHRGVDADHFSGGHRQSPTRVARVESGVGLDDVVDDTHAAPGAGRQRPAQGADHPGRHAPRETQGISDGNDELAHFEGGRLTQSRRRGGVAVSTDDGEVGKRVRPHHMERAGGAVGERGLPGVGAADDVGVREEKPVVGEHDGRARAGLEVATPPPTRHLHGRDPWVQFGGH